MEHSDAALEKNEKKKNTQNRPLLTGGPFPFISETGSLDLQHYGLLISFIFKINSTMSKVDPLLDTLEFHCNFPVEKIDVFGMRGRTKTKSEG